MPDDKDLEKQRMAMQEASASVQNWKPVQVYAMASICLLIGVALGYFFRGSQSSPAPTPAALASSNAPTAPTGMPSQMPSLEDMKRVADKQAEPLLAKLKTDPNNSQLLNQIGSLYKATHQFKEATEYFQRAIAADPKNIAARTDLATCLYYLGDADGAITQLQQALGDAPGDANSLFNLGIIRLQAKHDSAGALAAWQELLKRNPNLPNEKRTEVQKLIKQASTK
ncbi:MAG TPA: tetratricopeptide repeat protein [Candidatus Sulfotelmatobacter sp.]|nr:tetratricopeptide repeat protein [Candidatus Sulfotelmatobacter sp.]